MENKIYNNIKVQGTAKLKKKYPNITFTDSDRSSTTPKFPTVYIKKMQGASKGRSLQGNSLNAATFPYQIEVTTNTTQDDAEEVADVIADIMVSMGFDAVGTPFPDNSGDAFRVVARYERIIGAKELLNF